MVQETHRKNILTVKPFGNINFNLCSSAKELFVHFDYLPPHKHELQTMQNVKLIMRKVEKLGAIKLLQPGKRGAHSSCAALYLREA